MPLSGLVGLVYALFAPRLATISAGPDGPFAFGVLLFVLACRRVGRLRRPRLPARRARQAVVGGLAQRALRRRPPRSAGRSSAGSLALGSFGIVLSWVGPIVVWIVVGSLVICVLARRASAGATGGGAPEPDRDDRVPRAHRRGADRRVAALQPGADPGEPAVRAGDRRRVLHRVAGHRGDRPRRDVLHELPGGHRRPGAAPRARAGRRGAPPAADDLPADAGGRCRAGLPAAADLR